MNTLMCDNIREEVMVIHKKIEQQIQQPDTTREEREMLTKAKKSVKETIEFLLQAMKINVERGMSKK